MESKLYSLFSIQGSCIDVKTYQNEFETMRLLFDKMPELPRKYCGMLSLQWMQSMEEDENLEFSLKDNDEKINESKYLRQQGNQLFTAKGEQRNVLGACRLYNDAIFAALDITNSDELALGFANRAMALQTFGYYQQAYDDCVCAIRVGYPDSMRHKIITRQAYCTLKLEKIDLIEKHMYELQQIQLNNNFEKQRKELQEGFEELKRELANKNEKLQLKELPLNRESQEIISTSTVRGRYMQATTFIGKNQLIFSERASAFVPVGDTRLVCHQCGTVNFIPFPCLHCRGRVNYCSLKCQEDHERIHIYECQGYRFQLFAHVGIAHLALRIILDNGLLSILDELKTNNKTTSEVWKSLTEGGEIWKNDKIPYAETLRMISHLDKMTNMDIEWFALVSHHLVIYLRNYTTYFEMLNKNNNTIDWELLTASLMLRHIGQSISNGHTLTTIIPRPLTFFIKTDFHMLNDTIWSSPWHLKCGYLHHFSYYDDVATLNLPYLSLCNHSCIQSFQPKFSGRNISTFALCDLNKGDEISNCFDVDYRKAKRSARREKLRQSYHFECQCENCMQTDLEDVEFNQYHQYRCDNTKCGHIFIPNIPHKPTLNWWQSDTPNGIIDTNVNCTVCGCKQRFEWYHECKRLMFKVIESDVRRRLYRIFKNLENNLLGLNAARSYIAMKLVHEWFKLPYINVPLNDQDYCDIIDMLKYSLKITKSECCVNSIEYVTEMTYLWDLIAKRKYKCSKSVMDEMLAGLNIIADDLKEIFLNYYNDYLKDII